MKKEFKKRTKMVHGGVRRSQYGEVSEALFLTQSFVYGSAEEAEIRFLKSGDDDFIYARYGNPTVAMFEDRIALLEGAEAAFATASGMAAVHGTLCSILKTGDHVVASRALFGSCLYVLEQILNKFGVEVSFVDGLDLDQWEQAIRPDTRLVFFETISNPTLEVIDIVSVVRLAHDVGAVVVVDNVFVTPVFSNAIELGVDIVIYSGTKHIDGQGRLLGGVVLGTDEFINGTLEPFLKHTGGAMSSFNAWVMLKGMETIELRVRTQAETAARISKRLYGHSALERMIYPGHFSHPQNKIVNGQLSGAGTVIALDLKGGQEAAFKFLNSIEVGIISNNLGDSKSIYTHPATTTHQRLNDQQKKSLSITPGLIRFSAGLEDFEDLMQDILQAL